MGIHTAEAIVLRRYPFRETSVTLSCLTDRFGKLKGLVKGLRAQPNRHRSAMEPLTVNRIVFYDTRASQLHLISQCELVAPLEGLHRDLETMRLAAHCAELTDAVAPLEEPEPGLYRLFKETLEHLALGQSDPAALRLHFAVRLLRLAGFHPQLTECAACGQTVQAEGFWSAREGGLLCPGCLHEDPRAEPARRDVLETLADLAERAHPPALDRGLVPVLSRRLDTFLRWRLDVPLKTLVS